MKQLIMKLNFTENAGIIEFQILQTVCYDVSGVHTFRKTSGLNLLAPDVLRRLEIQAEKSFSEGCCD